MKQKIDGSDVSKYILPIRNNYYVYALMDPRSNLPFYIGKGTGNRAQTHLYRSDETGIHRTQDNIFKNNKINKIRSTRAEPYIIIFQKDMIESDAYDLEESLIKFYGRYGKDPNGILTNRVIKNIPPSALGRKWSEERRKRSMGRVCSTETRKRIGAKNSINMKGNIPWNKGRRDLKPSWNAGTRGVMKPNKTSWVKGQVAHNKGIAHSEEQKVKLKIAWIIRKGKTNGEIISKEEATAIYNRRLLDNTK